MASPEKLMFEREPIVQKKPVCEDHVEVIISKRNIRCKGLEVGIRIRKEQKEDMHGLNMVREEELQKTRLKRETVAKM